MVHREYLMVSSNSINFRFPVILQSHFLWVVFDGSAKTNSRISLNCRLMVWPKLQEHMITMLKGFWFHLVTLSVDNAKKYRQVDFYAKDGEYQRIMWNEPNSQDVQTYRMIRVTNGIALTAFHSIQPSQVFAEEVDEKITQLSIF